MATKSIRYNIGNSFLVVDKKREFRKFNNLSSMSLGYMAVMSKIDQVLMISEYLNRIVCSLKVSSPMF